MDKVLAFLGRVLFLADGVGGRLRQYRLRQQMNCSRSVAIGSGSTFTTATVALGNDVTIGRDCCIQSAHGRIIIGDHVMLGPDVHIHGGDHIMDRPGLYMREIASKKPGDDGCVVIEDDCWIGARAIILKGVTIGRGSIVGAGSVVTKDIPPYSIYTGVPDVRIRARFTPDQVRAHEEALNARMRAHG